MIGDICSGAQCIDKALNIESCSPVLERDAESLQILLQSTIFVFFVK